MKTRRITQLGLAFVVAIAWIGIGQAVGHEITIVAPTGLEDMEGSNRIDTGDGPFRVQFLYAASDFRSLPEGHRLIVGTAGRADDRQSNPFSRSYADLEIRLSTTSVNDLSTTYADNIGQDETLVFDGPSSVSYPATGPAEGPRPFSEGGTFQTPFFYEPSLGNLLVDITAPLGSTGDSGSFDAHETVGSRSLVSGDPTQAVGQWDTIVQVRQFTFVPEPTTFALVCLGLIGLLAAKKRD
ncbi:MAG: PEP-CTERM sorting domain-containing protein [Pirellulaceae bacterium]